MPNATNQNGLCIDIPNLGTFPTLMQVENDAPDGWHKFWPPNSNQSKSIVKIVLGELGKEELQPGNLPMHLKDHFPNLTHLHIWGLELSASLPELPVGLQCLDIRSSRLLKKVPPLPTSLEQLILEDNPELAEVQLPGEAQALWDLSLRGCGLLGDAVLAHLLERTPHLRRLDASELGLLTKITAWPRFLERIDLDRCARLYSLPEQWPARLRRLGLRGACSIKTLPEFEDWPDYLDLAGTASLIKLQQPKSGRTLFLYGSGVRIPPASEHGKDANENVAQRLREYYGDCELLGSGKVNRCKLLVLGNGSAGKTCLSAALIPGGDPRVAATMGSTHGVQFWPWQLQGVELPGSHTNVNVDVHVWDFGGQEIYHQTHRLFMAKGAVFLIAWNPAQEKGKPEPTAEGYQDVWRPIEYWVDFVQQACPWGPRIAIVRTHATRWGKGERERLKQLADTSNIAIDCFVVDSLEGNGQLSEVRKWIATAVAGVVASQGTAVPAHWMIAQQMVESWFPREAPGRPLAGTEPKHLDISRDRFEAELIEAVKAKLDDPDFRKVATAIRADPSCLGGRRLDRLLDFLTHSGWIYWDPKLFEERIIVSQRWALDGIYAALDRRKDTKVFGALRDSEGIFTRETLDEHVWRAAGVTVNQQELLLSFMEQAGVAVRLITAEQSLWDRATYLSLQHLPTADELHMGRRMEKESLKQQRVLNSDAAHRSHWTRILADLAAQYGRNGRYARDGFLIEGAGGQVQCIQFTMDRQNGLEAANKRDGIGATLTLEVAGPKAEERIGRLEAFLLDRLPRDPLDPPKGTSIEEPGQERSQKRTLFVSYAWDPIPGQEGFVEPGAGALYEEPVNKLEEFLKPFESQLDLDRDRLKVRSGSSITAFIELITKDDFLLVVHSDKYWRSWYCMAEITSAIDSTTNRRVSFYKDVALFVEHTRSGLGDDDARKAYLDYWETAMGFPSCLNRRPCGDQETARVRNLSFFRSEFAKIDDLARKCRWNPKDPRALERWLVQELKRGGLNLEH